MHIHDEVVIEADPRMSLDAVCEQMGRTPSWAKGLLLRADGYATPFYQKRLKRSAQLRRSSPVKTRGGRFLSICLNTEECQEA